MGEASTGATPRAAHNLLSDLIIHVRKTDGKAELVSLPKLFELLMADEIESLPTLRPHQKQSFHCFLSQLGAMALLSVNECETRRSADTWATLLRGLTPDFARDEPWCLVVDDWSKPAFMQAPVPQGSWTPPQKDPIADTPDQIDIPSGSKHHDVKSSTVPNDSPPDWLFSLITLQTQQGYFGSGNYGIGRMKSGAALRPFVGARGRNDRMGSSVRRDIDALIKNFPNASKHPVYVNGSNNICLTWIKPWDGKNQLTPNQLHPYFVEICRRIRLKPRGKKTIACRSTSASKRIAMPDQLKGAVGDPWAPAKVSNNAEVFSVPNKSFQGIGYKLVTQLIDPRRYTMSPLGKPRPDEFPQGYELVFMMLPRDEGKTYGYHERRVTFSPEIVDVLSHDPSSTLFSDIADGRVHDLTKVAAGLELALFGIAQPPSDLKSGTIKEIKKSREFREFKGKAKTKVFISRFDRSVDADFFERLFEELPETPGSQAAKAHRRRWLLDLKGRARDALAAAEAGSPLSGVRRYRARAAAENLLDGAINNAFGELLKSEART